MQTLTILGSTGSVGVNTLDVVSRHAERFRVAAITGHSHVDALFEQCVRHRPEFAVLVQPGAARILAQRIAGVGLSTRVLSGEQGLTEVATLPHVDTVMAAIVGIAGLRSTFAAARAGKRLLLANKESLVTAGAVFMDAVRSNHATLLPIDSEHNAIFQVLPHDYAGDLAKSGVRRILLTASGGPFRTLSLNELAGVTPEAACSHPNWIMGRKISVDSATMMNKGLEVIEAQWLFGAAAHQIEVVIHPESIVHSLVEYVDGSVLAQLGHPDMRTPIAQALAAPERIDSGVPALELAQLAQLTFARPDHARFPCLGLAYDALRADAGAPIALNAANEVAVDAFLAGRARFTDIARACTAALSRRSVARIAHLDDALAADAEARAIACAELDIPMRPGVSMGEDVEAVR